MENKITPLIVNNYNDSYYYLQEELSQITKNKESESSVSCNKCSSSSLTHEIPNKKIQDKKLIYCKNCGYIQSYE